MYSRHLRLTLAPIKQENNMPTLRWLTRDEDVRAAEKVPYRLLEEVEGRGTRNQDILDGVVRRQMSGL